MKDHPKKCFQQEKCPALDLGKQNCRTSRIPIWVSKNGFSLVVAGLISLSGGTVFAQQAKIPTQSVPVVPISSGTQRTITTRTGSIVPIIQKSKQDGKTDSSVQPKSVVTGSGVSEVPVAQAQPASPSPVPSSDPKPDAKKAQAALNKKAAGAYKGVFYANDFSYLLDPNYKGYHLGENWKKRPLFGAGSYDIGGQFRLRAHFEQNHRGLGLTGRDDQFLLYRTRLYGDFQLTENIRFYAEMIDAESTNEDFNPRPIEVNRTDMQNLFFDAKLVNIAGSNLVGRVGRQEILLGAQRQVSPLDWANTRRTFDGGRLMWKNDKWSIDSFWLQPMRIDDSSFDSPDRDQEFMGTYASYKKNKNQNIDAYFIRYLNGRGSNNFEFNTVGARFNGKKGNILYDFEAAYQFGDNSDGSDHSAGMATFGIGRKFENQCWKPTLWLFYDWASGDNDLGAGNGYHHNFPLAHKYQGFMDLFGRRNIEDVNVQLSMNPTKKLKLLLWYHYFFLETQSDSPYSVVMTPFNGGNAPGSASLGHEIDFVAAYKISKRQQLALGYSHFFAGDYYQTTAGVPFTGDANFFYTQWSVNF